MHPTFISTPRQLDRGPKISTHLSKSLPQPRLPLVERLEEVRSLRVTDAARKQPRAPARREQLVDDARHALERAHPVAVPAPEHREARARELVALQALQPLEEVRGVVRGLACAPRVSACRTWREKERTAHLRRRR